MEIAPGTRRGPHTILVPSCSWDHSPLPFPAGNTMFGHTHRGLGSSVCFLWGFIALSGPWLRPGLELPALQINSVIHPGLFGFRAGRLWHQPKAAPVRLPWTKDGSTKPLGSPFCPTQGFGSCGGTAGGSLRLLRAGPGEDLGVWWLQVCSRTHPPSSQLSRDWL